MSLRYFLGLLVFLVAIHCIVYGVFEQNTVERLAGFGLIGAWYSIAFPYSEEDKQ